MALLGGSLLSIMGDYPLHQVRLPSESKVVLHVVVSSGCADKLSGKYFQVAYIGSACLRASYYL